MSAAAQPAAARRRRAWLGALLLLVLACVRPVAAAGTCRQALALGLDVSGSVDGREYRMQIDGLAAALRDPRVVAALLALPAAPVRISVFEWSGTSYQRLLVDWTEIIGAHTLAAVADRLAATGRSPASPGTALGTAMRFGAALVAGQRDCWKRTLDLSGDGRHNVGPHPRDVRSTLAGQDFTLNGLVIGADAPHGSDRRQEDIAALSAYFGAWVILGPGAFVETALGFEDYRAAMIRKLLRELQGPTLSALEPGPGPGPAAMR